MAEGTAEADTGEATAGTPAVITEVTMAAISAAITEGRGPITTGIVEATGATDMVGTAVTDTAITFRGIPGTGITATRDTGMDTDPDTGITAITTIRIITGISKTI